MFRFTSFTAMTIKEAVAAATAAIVSLPPVGGRGAALPAAASLAVRISSTNRVAFSFAVGESAASASFAVEEYLNAYIGEVASISSAPAASSSAETLSDLEATDGGGTTSALSIVAPKLTEELGSDAIPPSTAVVVGLVDDFFAGDGMEIVEIN